MIETDLDKIFGLDTRRPRSMSLVKVEKLNGMDLVKRKIVLL